MSLPESWIGSISLVSSGNARVRSPQIADTVQVATSFSANMLNVISTDPLDDRVSVITEAGIRLFTWQLFVPRADIGNPTTDNFSIDGASFMSGIGGFLTIGFDKNIIPSFIARQIWVKGYTLY